MGSPLQRIREFFSEKFNKVGQQRFNEFVEIIRSNQIPSDDVFTADEIATFCLKRVDRTRKTVLHIAAESGSDEVLEYLLGFVENPDVLTTEHVTPLMIAIGLMDFGKIKLLSEKGACPNCLDSSGSSPVAMVVVNDESDILQHLLNYGLDPNLYADEHDQSTILHIACGVGNLRQVRLLVEHGVSLQYQNACGQAPIHMAVMGDYDDVVAFLIAAGDDINHPDAEGLTPLNYARSYNATKVEKLLLDKKAAVRNDLWMNRDPMNKFDEIH